MKSILFKKTLKPVSFVAAIILSVLLAGCADDNNNDDPVANAPAGEETTAGAGGGAGTQVDRLARPAINEGLILDNDLLNLFNTVDPTVDTTAAAAPILAQAASVLDAFDAVDGKEDITVTEVVTGFLPDVMRIDTRLNISVGKTAYNAAFSGDKGILIGGRKIEDDVIDITLSLLVAKDPTGKAVKDNVSYWGVPGNRAQTGHQPLYGQRRARGPAQFPFLATPN